MTPNELKRTRRALGLTQEELARRLKTTRMTITRYEAGTHQIPGSVQVAMAHFASSPQIPLVGIVAAGDPIEPVPQSEVVEVPLTMLKKGENFALRIKGESMREEGILPDDVVIVHKQNTARNGETVVAVVNGEATIKKYYRRPAHIELHAAHPDRKPVIVRSGDEFRIEGVLIGVIRHCR